MPSNIYSTPQVAELLGVNRATAGRYAVELGIPRVGRAYMWTDESLAEARALASERAVREKAGLKQYQDGKGEGAGEK